jgi:uncharacterized membrane protein
MAKKKKNAVEPRQNVFSHQNIRKNKSAEREKKIDKIIGIMCLIFAIIILLSLLFIPTVSGYDFLPGKRYAP